MTTWPRRTAGTLLALLLAPLLVLTMPSVSEAASTAVSPSKPWTIDMANNVLGAAIGGPRCTGSARWTKGTGAPSLDWTTQCYIYGAEASVYGGFDSGSYTSVMFFGQNSQGDTCTLASSANLSTGNPGSATGSAHFLVWVEGVTCSITYVCQRVHWSRNNWKDSDFGFMGDSSAAPGVGYGGACSELQLGDYPTSDPVSNSGTCQFGTFDPPTYAPPGQGGATNLDAFTSLFHPANQSTWNNSNVTWVYYVYMSDGTILGGDSHPNATSPNYAMHSLGGPGGAAPNQFYWAQARIYEGDAGWNGRKPIGFGFYWAPNNNPGNVGLPQNVGGGRVGVTDPSQCSFYWGTKVAAVTGSDIDEPNGPMPGATDAGLTPPADPTPPPQPTTGCNFSVTDPSTWAGGGMCVATGLLGEILRALKNVAAAVGGLASAIVNGLKGVLKTLFIPNASDFAWGSFIDQFKARPPGSLILGLGSMFGAIADGFTGSGDCGVLADFGDFKITCQNVKNTPGYGAGYALVSVGIIGLTGYRMWGMVSSALGGGGSE